MVNCRNYNNTGSPHLWHYQPFLASFRYLKTQHICRACGTVMYETGGKISPVGWIKAFLSVYMLAGIVIVIGMPIMGEGKSILLAGALQCGFWGLVGYHVYRALSKKKPN